MSQNRPYSIALYILIRSISQHADAGAASDEKRASESIARAQMRTEDEQISERERSWLGSHGRRGKRGRERGGSVAVRCGHMGCSNNHLERRPKSARKGGGREGGTTDAARKKAFATNSRCPPCLARSSHRLFGCMPGTDPTHAGSPLTGS